MSALSVEPPYPAFADADGQPLEDGYIWIGTVNLNPITNPIVAYWDDALTITAVQPIRTSGGYPVYQGTPSRIYTDIDYSIQVQNKNGTVVYTSLNGNAFPGSAGNLVVNATGTGTQTVFSVAFVPSLIYINGVYQNQNTYTLAGGNVTFSQAPPFNSIIEFVF
jgi:hypothetical protein